MRLSHMQRSMILLVLACVIPCMLHGTGDNTPDVWLPNTIDLVSLTDGLDSNSCCIFEECAALCNLQVSKNDRLKTWMQAGRRFRREAVAARTPQQQLQLMRSRPVSSWPDVSIGQPAWLINMDRKQCTMLEDNRH
jgi:hypothetical protein